MVSRARTLLGCITAVFLGGGLAQACNPNGVDDSFEGAGGGASTSAATTGSGSDGGGGTSLVDLDGGITGAGGLGAGGGCASVSSEAKATFKPADLIIAVDTSGSMFEEAAEVKANLNQLASLIAASGVDVHVILLSDDSICIPAPLGSGSCPADEKLPGYRHVDQFVQSNNGLDLIVSTYPDWKSSLRPDATKTFAIVSDDDSYTSAATFTNELLALDPPTFQGFKFDAIVAFDNPQVCDACHNACADCQSKCCDPLQNCFPISAAEGKVYKMLVAQTGGVLANLCGQDFSPVFVDMATAVVQSSTIDCVYEIPPVPDGETFDSSKVNVSYTPGGGSAETIGNVPEGAAGCTDAGGWYYDDAENPTQILLCDATCTAVQGSATGKVDVVFGCDTIIVN